MSEEPAWLKYVKPFTTGKLLVEGTDDITSFNTFRSDCNLQIGHHTLTIQKSEARPEKWAIHYYDSESGLESYIMLASGMMDKIVSHDFSNQLEWHQNILQWAKVGEDCYKGDVELLEEFEQHVVSLKGKTYQFSRRWVKEPDDTPGVAWVVTPLGNDDDGVVLLGSGDVDDLVLSCGIRWIEPTYEVEGSSSVSSWESAFKRRSKQRQPTRDSTRYKSVSASDYGVVFRVAGKNVSARLVMAEAKSGGKRSLLWRVRETGQSSVAYWLTQEQMDAAMADMGLRLKQEQARFFDQNGECAAMAINKSAETKGTKMNTLVASAKEAVPLAGAYHAAKVAKAPLLKAIRVRFGEGPVAMMVETALESRYGTGAMCFALGAVIPIIEKALPAHMKPHATAASSAFLTRGSQMFMEELGDMVLEPVMAALSALGTEAVAATVSESHATGVRVDATQAQAAPVETVERQAARRPAAASRGARA